MNYQGEKTKCCNADFEVISSNEGTAFYKCLKCSKPCDVASSYNSPINVCRVCKKEFNQILPHSLCSPCRELLEANKLK